MSKAMVMEIKAFFEIQTSTLTYVVFDEVTKDAILIDPLLDYRANSGQVSTESVKEVLKFISDRQLNLLMILETHVHADHLSSSQVVKQHYPQAILAIGSRIKEVQKTFSDLLSLDISDQDQLFDRLLEDGEIVKAGSLEFKVIFAPGHTPACVLYQFADRVFTGDVIFMPDFGTGRCDFPGGDARALYFSIKDKVYSLPDDTKLFVGHDYQPGGRELRYVSSVAEQKQANVHLSASTSEAEFVAFRTERDKSLNVPALLYPSIQINMRGGRLPVADDQGRRFLKIPLTER